MRPSTRTQHTVIVIGAGQTGLAAAYHLARRGIEFVVLEASDRVGDVWRSRYDSLRLYSPAKYDGLPGLAFPLGRPDFPTGRQMGGYLEAYVAHHQIPVETGVRVDGLRQGDGEPGYTVTAGDRTYGAEQVIVATGVFQRPYVPEVAARVNPGIRQLHSSEYRGPAQLADGPVLVVGLSHSGADIAHEVALAGHATCTSGRPHGELPFSVDSRRARLAWPLLRFLATRVLTRATPLGRRMAAHIRHGGAPLLRMRSRELRAAGVTPLGARTVDVDEAGRPRLDDGTVVDVANVIWCTGFRPDYRWIDLPILDEDGWPVQERGVVGAAPGLYVMGVPFLYGFSSMLVLGAARDAAHIVERVASHRRDAPGGVARDVSSMPA